MRKKFKSIVGACVFLYCFQIRLYSFNVIFEKMNVQNLYEIEVCGLDWHKE